MNRILILATLLVVAGCSGDDENAPLAPPLAEEVVDASGGTLRVPDDGITLEFPPGSLSDATTVTVREASRAPADVIGRAYEFGPSGAQFAEPVEFRFDFLAGDLADATLPHELALLRWDDGGWTVVEGALVEAAGSASNGTLTVPLQHFSTYAVARVDGVNTFYGTFGFGPDDVYAYGRESDGDGRIVHWNGNDVATAHTVAGGRVFDGWGAAPDEHFALAYDGTGRILRSPDGTTWTEVATNPEALLAIHGNGAWRIAVGYGQTIVENDGSAWTAATGVPTVPGFPVPRPLHAVVVTGPGEAFAGGDDVLLERSGGAWSVVDLGNELTARFTVRGLWARAADDVHAVGWETVPGQPREPIVLHFDGTAWTVEQPGASLSGLLNGVWGSANRTFAVGTRGTLLEETAFFAPQIVQTNANLYDVWAHDDTTLAFVGAEGIFTHPGVSDPGTGGSGDCSGTADVFLDFRASSGATSTLDCNASRTVRGFPVSVREVLPAQAGDFFDCDTSQSPCNGSIDGTARGADTFLFFENCSRVSIDLSGDARTLGCVEIDVVDFCDDGCDGGLGSRTVAFLYDAQDQLIDVQGSLLSGAETLELDASSGRAARLDIRFTYGGLEGVRLFFD